MEKKTRISAKECKPKMKHVSLIAMAFASNLIACTQNTTKSNSNEADKPATIDSLDKTEKQENRHCGRLNIGTVDYNVKNDGKKSVDYVILALDNPVDKRNSVTIGWSQSRPTLETIGSLLNLELIKEGDSLEACLNGRLKAVPSRGGSELEISQLDSLDIKLPIHIKGKSD